MSMFMFWVMKGRRNKDARMMIKNKARVEGSIVEAYVLKEISTFCSHYFDPDRRKFQLSKGRHDVGPEMPLDGKPAIFNYPGKGRGNSLRNLSWDEMTAAQIYVLDNSGCPFIDDLSEAFNASVRARNPRQTLDEASLQRIRVKDSAIGFVIKHRRKPNWDHQTVRTDSDPDIFQEQWPGCDYEVTGGEELDIHTVLVDQGILEAVNQGELAKLTSRVQSTVRDDETGSEIEEENELNNDEGTDQLEEAYGSEADEPYGW
ncbi:hypothetical protein FCM35_KLT22184 [Carex littledalei]|uniref:DUF4218 domain-containing protein n=1 Tax=Carex littledalei TaxID=544730 RepID=A0A833QGZ9_9POAL|nr:hypothetical protein FCM35_KLT22184 [Carex littledalei]